MDALTLAIIIAALVLLIGGAFWLVEATDQPDGGVASQSEPACLTGQASSEQSGRTSEIGVPIASGPWGSTCSSRSIPSLGP